MKPSGLITIFASPNRTAQASSMSSIRELTTVLAHPGSPSLHHRRNVCSSRSKSPRKNPSSHAQMALELLGPWLRVPFVVLSIRRPSHVLRSEREGVSVFSARNPSPPDTNEPRVIPIASRTVLDNTVTLPPVLVVASLSDGLMPPDVTPIPADFRHAHLSFPHPGSALLKTVHLAGSLSLPARRIAMAAAAASRATAGQMTETPARSTSHPVSQGPKAYPPCVNSGRSAIARPR